MKSFKQYLTENKKEYKFRIKYAGTLAEIEISKIERVVEKYGLMDISKQKTTPIQEHPMHFQTMRNTEVSMVDVTVRYPTTTEILRNELSTYAGLNSSQIVVINSDNPTEISREELAELEDDEYKQKLTTENDMPDAAVVDPTEFYGDKYNEKFVKDLLKNRETPEIMFAVDNKEGKAKKQTKKDKSK